MDIREEIRKAFEFAKKNGCGISLTPQQTKWLDEQLRGNKATGTEEAFEEQLMFEIPAGCNARIMAED